MRVNSLPADITLRLYTLQNEGPAGNILFSSAKKWLHPLFDTEEFLNRRAADFGTRGRSYIFNGGLKCAADRLFLRDRVTGRAAAFFIARLGIKKVETDLLSLGAMEIFKKNSISFNAAVLTPAIACATEKELEAVTDPGAIYTLLTARRNKALKTLIPFSALNTCL